MDSVGASGMVDEIVISGTVEVEVDEAICWGSTGGDDGRTQYLEDMFPEFWLFRKSSSGKKKLLSEFKMLLTLGAG